MQLTSILTLAIWALGVSANPAANNLARTNAPSCQGGTVYNDAHHKCECPPKKSWEHDKKNCSHPLIEPPKCSDKQKCFCSKDKDSYCKYVCPLPTSFFPCIPPSSPTWPSSAELRSCKQEGLVPRRWSKLRLIL